MPFDLFASPSKDRKSFHSIHSMATRSQVPFNDDGGAFVKAVDEKGNFVLRSKRLGTPTKTIFSPPRSTPKKSPAARRLFSADAKPGGAAIKKEHMSAKKGPKKSPTVANLCDLFSTKVSINDDSPSSKAIPPKCLSSVPDDGRYHDLVETRDPGLYTPVKRCVRFRDGV